MADRSTFNRMGEPVRIPITPTSGSTVFGPLTLPSGATSFQWTNNNPFSVRLRGWRKPTGYSGPLPPTGVLVTAETGWLWMPGTQGVRASLMPMYLWAMSVDGPYAATSKEQKAGNGFVELQYGTGGNS